ncbi:hypothetical protein [Herpetosiphon llansteffanensis]|uniref:hypothetical protein n=1 Tax=Herpetosiphon llansteffanensis TaxID=2094568 RepID=UPI000D7CA16A|nr:hypothetical protein [Herpetosiphon llansteffanensis]
MQRIGLAKSTHRTLRYLIILGVLIVGIAGYQFNHASAQQSLMPVAISNGYRASYDLSLLDRDSTYVIEGEIIEIEASRWTTPDGLRPLDMQQLQTDPTIQLRTPIRIAIDKLYKGALDTPTMLFTLPGGSDDQYIVSTEWDMQLAKGQKIIVFLSVAPEKAGPWAQISPYYPQAIFNLDETNNLEGATNSLDYADFKTIYGSGIAIN